MPCILLHQTLQIYPPFDHRSWEDQYTASLWHILISYPEIHWYHFTVFSISHMYIASLSLMQLTICMQLKHSFLIVIIFKCCHCPTNSLHTVKMLICYHRHFLLSSICKWLFSGACVVYNIPSVGVKGTSSVPWSSANFCSISQNMHYEAPVAAQHWKANKVVCTWKDDWPPGELLLTKDLLPKRVTV